MALAKIFSASVLGLDAMPVEVEVDISQGLPSFTIVGLPDKAIEESKERVRSAIRNSKVQFPVHRLTVNLFFLAVVLFLVLIMNFTSLEPVPPPALRRLPARDLISKRLLP